MSVDKGKERELVRRVRDGDEGAFVDLFRLYEPRIRLDLRANGVQGVDRDDIVQEASRRLLEALRQNSIRTRPAAWIMRVVRNLRVSLYRQSRRKPKPTTPNEPEQPHAVAEHRELRAILMKAVEELPESQRIPIRMWLRGRTYADIGEACGISSNAAGLRVMRAIERLRRGLVDD